MSVFGVIAALAIGASSATAPAPLSAKAAVQQVFFWYAAPGVFQTCDQVNPTEANTYDKALEAWQQRNQSLIQQVIPQLKEQHTLDGSTYLEYLKSHADLVIERFNKLPLDQQISGCTRQLNHLNSN